MKPFNPLEKINLAKSIVQELLSQNIHPLPPPIFEGAGVYALYYSGSHDLYASLALPSGKEEKPIYVGKAVPPGARIGGYGLNTPPGAVLFNRLREHALSIDQAEDLDLKDFRCRYLVVDDIWIPLAETLLIEMYRLGGIRLSPASAIMPPEKGDISNSVLRGIHFIPVAPGRQNFRII